MSLMTVGLLKELCVLSQGLLLLQQLTKGNAAIQKIVAFENAFERLLDIITEEGTSDGGMLCRRVAQGGSMCDVDFFSSLADG